MDRQHTHTDIHLAAFHAGTQPKAYTYCIYIYNTYKQGNIFPQSGEYFSAEWGIFFRRVGNFFPQLNLKQP